jgi:hypothetical protein
MSTAHHPGAEAMRLRVMPIIATAALAALLSGCGSPTAATAPGTTTRDTATPHASTPSNSAAAGKQKPAKTGLTAWGATRTVWEANHDQAPGYLSGAAYLPMVTDPADGTSPLPKYGTVLEDNGVIGEYSMNLPAGTSLAGALALARLELPTGVTLGSAIRSTDGDGNTCRFYPVTSSRLSGVLGGNMPLVTVYYNDADVPVDVTFDAYYKNRADLAKHSC